MNLGELNEEISIINGTSSKTTSNHGEILNNEIKSGTS